MQFFKSSYGYKLIEYEIPSNWTNQRLGEITEIIVPMRDKPKQFDGNIPWIRIEDFEGKFVFGSKSGRKVSERTIKEMNLKPYPIGTVLCSCSGNMGICAITKSIMVSNQTFAGLIPKEEINSDYLYYLLSNFKDRLQRMASGTTILYLSREKFENLVIPVPLLKEQQKIVFILSNVDEVIQKTKQIIEQSQRLKKGLMQRLMTKGIGHTKFKDSEIGKIPYEWHISSIGQEFIVGSGGTPSRSNSSYFNGNVP